MKMDIFIFLIEKEKVFIKFMEIVEKLRHIIKNRFNSELIYSKKCLKAEKSKINTKGGFQCLYASVILIDLIYRENEHYYRKLFFEKYYFIKDIKIYCSNFEEEYYDEECINLFSETYKK